MRSCLCSVTRLCLAFKRPLPTQCRLFTTSRSRGANPTKIVGSLEKRIADIPLDRYRNFCIVAHVDHGKSTLSDRLLELTGTIETGGKKQVLDKLDVERERGITVKAQTCSMLYHYKEMDFLLHLVDTPGVGDFGTAIMWSDLPKTCITSTAPYVST